MLAKAIPLKRKSKFSNMTKSDWIEANEQTKKHRGISGITYSEIKQYIHPNVEVLNKQDEENILNTAKFIEDLVKRIDFKNIK